MVSTMNTLEKLRANQDQAEGDYATLAEQIADGRQVDEKKAQGVLRQAGKSADDLEREVARLHRIVELGKVIVDCGVERQELTKSQAELGERLQKAREQRTSLEVEIRQGEAEYTGTIAHAGIISDRMSEARRELAGLQSQGEERHNE